MKVIEKSTPHEVEEDQPPIVLKNWWRVEWSGSLQLTGNVYGHPRFPDGEVITTSVVQWMDEALGIARTRNTLYILRDRAK